MLTRWPLYPYAHTLYCTKHHKIPVNGYQHENRELGHQGEHLGCPEG